MSETNGKINPQKTKWDSGVHSIDVLSGNKYIFISLLVIITFIAFFPTLSCGFVDWDDPSYILENDLLNAQNGLLSFDNIKRIFTSDVDGSYNPIPILTFAIEKQFVAPDPATSPFIFHFDNLLLHICNTVLVFAIFLRFRLPVMGAFMGALLFGIHPMRVESVAWATERKDVLYGLFYLAAILCYTNYIDNREKYKKWHFFAIGCSVLALFSKIQAVCLPLAFVTIDYLNKRKWRSAKVLIIEKAPWWILSATFGLASIYLLNKGGHFSPEGAYAKYGLIDRLAVGTYTYGIYLIKAIYPYRLTYFHDYPDQLPMMAFVSLVCIPVLTVAVAIWANKQKLRYMLFGMAFFTVHVAFLLQIVPVGLAFQADRFTYIGYAGLFFIAGKLYSYFINKYNKDIRFISAGLVLYFTTLAIATYTQAQTWTDTPALCEQYIKCYPNSYNGYNQAGIYYLKAATAKFDDNDSYFYRLKKADRYFKEADEADSINGRTLPTISSDIYINEGIVNALTGDSVKAIYYFTKAIAATPKSATAYDNRGYQYYRNKQYDEAIQDFTDALKIEPDNHNTYYKRANCYYALKRFPDAIFDLNKAIELKSDDPNYFIARSVVYRAEGNSEKAIADAQQAKRLGGKVPEQFF